MLDFHPIELTAQGILGGPLETINTEFDLLTQSQYILLTRLRTIEERLVHFKDVVEKDDDDVIDVTVLARQIKSLKQRLHTCDKTIRRVEDRVSRLES